ncbi:hypothetical protein LguiA_023293 [Lonicera macranthoides]
MGNCIKKESPTEWAGEDWGSPVPEPLSFIDQHKAAEEKGVNGGGGGVTEVKVKITKKQLEELLGKRDVQGLTVQQVLAQLIKVSGDDFQSNQRPWRPALQSIPEVD